MFDYVNVIYLAPRLGEPGGLGAVLHIHVRGRHQKSRRSAGTAVETGVGRRVHADAAECTCHALLLDFASGQLCDRRRARSAGSGPMRVKTLGPSGHLFSKAIQAAGNVSRGMEERKNARQVQLTYLRHDNTPMPLPGPQDPLAVGLGTADAIVIQALMRRAEIVDLAPSQDAYSLNMITDGVATMQPPVERAAAESAIQALKVLVGAVGRGAAASADRAVPLARCRGCADRLDRAHFRLGLRGARGAVGQRKGPVGHAAGTTGHDAPSNSRTSRS